MVTWTEAEKRALAELEEESKILDAQSAELEAAEKAERESPASMLAAKRAEIQAKRDAFDAADREKRERSILAKLEAEHGKDRVAAVWTIDGGIFQRAATMQEIDAVSFGASSLPAYDKEKKARNSIRNCILYPAHPVFDAHIEKHPGLWLPLAEMRDALISGVRESAEKKG